MALDDWKKSAEGRIAMAPVASVAFARVDGMGGVRLEFAASIDDLRESKTASLQLALTALQAREIGQALVKLAGDLEADAAQVDGGTQH